MNHRAPRAIYRLIINQWGWIALFFIAIFFCFVFHSKLPVRDGQERTLERSSFLFLKHVSMYFTPSVEKLFEFILIMGDMYNYITG